MTQFESFVSAIPDSERSTCKLSSIKFIGTAISDVNTAERESVGPIINLRANQGRCEDCADGSHSM